MKRALPIVSLSALLFTVLAGAFFIRVGFANPALPWGARTIPPNPSTPTPQITIISPNNNTAHYNGTIELTFNVTKPIGDARLVEVRYKTSWMNQWISLVSSHEGGVPSNFFESLILEKVPDGEQNVEIYTRYVVYYRYPTEQSAFVRSCVTASSTVKFTVDTTLPRVVVLTPQSQTYETFDVPLNFTVNRQTAWMGYSLDGQDNVTIMGNTTLTGLSAGMHTLLFSVVDEVGNEVSEAVTFSVSEPPQPFPMVEVATVAFVSAAAVSILASLLLYAKRRKRKLNQPQAK